LILNKSKGRARIIENKRIENNLLNYYDKILLTGRSLTSVFCVPYLKVGNKYPYRYNGMGRKYTEARKLEGYKAGKLES
jgi:hypothetical protein